MSFSSGHRYWLPHLSEEENRRLFGRWASPYNHGHNYVLEMTVSGAISPQTGMVINIKELDALLRRRIVDRFDQKSLNDEVDEFAELPPTTETISLVIWRQMLDLPQGTRLESIQLFENERLFVQVSRNNGGYDMTLTRCYEFSASHRLHCPQLSDAENAALFGKCNNPTGHGHNYELEVSVRVSPDPVTGMGVDIGVVDEIVNREVVDRYDHHNLNDDIEEFHGLNPTTEVLTRTIWRRLNGKLPVPLQKVVVKETARNYFEYSGEDE